MKPSPFTTRNVFFLALTIVLSMFIAYPRLARLSALPLKSSASALPGREPAVKASPFVTITVNTTADTVAADGFCSLREAIINANGDNQSGSTDCAAGSSADTITFSVTGTITLASNLPQLNTNLTINGPGANLLTVSGNNARRVFNTAGAASVTLNGLTIAAGNLTGGGGGLLNTSTGTVSITACAFTGNVSAGPFGGGAIFTENGPMNITNSQITGNSGGGGGGILINGAAAAVALTNVTLSGNVTTALGGQGGAINHGSGILNLTNCTIFNNTATGGGGGISTLFGGTLNSRNTIIAGNTSPGGPDVAGPVVSLGNNLIGDTSGGSGFVASDLQNVNPRLGPLANNGGPTLTHGLRGDSPAIDAGTVTGAPATDQRGLARNADGNGDNTNAVDIGALEVQKLLVTNTNDSGAGSLRQAITDNNAAGSNLIAFNIVSGTNVKTITPASPLPTISRMVTINGYTQPGSSANTLATGNDALLLIELSGASAGGGANGLTLNTGFCDVRGLVINRFNAHGIQMLGSPEATENHITGNFIGVNPAGTAVQANTLRGISVESDANTIGGFLPAARNVISGNGTDGIGIVAIGSGALGNQIRGNYIGTNAAGTAAIGNAQNGIGTNGVADTIIGGTAAGARNVISGNGSAGILISGAGNNQVVGNLIGTSATGTAALPNGNFGVRILNTLDNFIGGAAAGAGNLISGNNVAGVSIEGSSSGNNQVLGNLIGTNLAGSAALPNNGTGVSVSSGVNGTMIGGTTPNARNIISGNTGDGVELAGTTSAVQGNYIGLNQAGTAAIANSSNGISIASSGNTIGGTAAGAGNVISGNGLAGVFLFGVSTTNNVLQGNFIGTNAAGTSALGNAQNGVRIDRAHNTTIGGTTAGSGNVISGNSGTAGLFFQSSSFNELSGNFIGTNAAGTAGLGTQPNGVVIEISSGTAANNFIGGTVAGARNVISGNTNDGVRLAGSLTSSNFVRGNFIGTDVTGTVALGNGRGVAILQGSDDNNIGGTVAGEGNLIAFNSVGIGVQDNGTLNNRLLGNSIFSNTGRGIDLENDGVTPNDVGDPDNGANRRQNFPVLNFVTSGGFVGGSLDSLPANTAYPVRIEFFASGACDASGDGQGEVFLGFTSLAAQGFFNFSFTPIGGKTIITATATDANGNTSEFSACRTVGEAPIVVNTTADTVAADGFCSLREAILAANTNAAVNECVPVSAGLDNIVFALGTGTPTIAVTGFALPAITEPLTIVGATGGATRVELNGAAAGASADGLVISAGNTLVTSLVINRFGQNGIVINTAGGDSVQGCLIGTNAAGTAALANGVHGIYINSASNNTIGGVTPGAGNVLAGNTLHGVVIEGASATNNVVQGNFIGTNITGGAAVPNASNGVVILNAPGNTVGGTVAAARNLISGNTQHGVVIDGASNNQVVGNFIGTNGAGAAALGNGAVGVFIAGTDNTVGGITAAGRNIISGNGVHGVFISGAGVTGNQVRGNYIGTDSTGTAAVPNVQHGVVIQSASSNTIGGTLAGAGNVISGNTSAGIVIDGAATTNNQVQGNLIGTNVSGNAALGNLNGVLLQPNASNNTIGGTTPAARNVISGNTGAGISIGGAGATNNQVQGNYIGTDLSGTAALGNGTGVLINGAPNNTIGGTANGAGNIISGNGNVGVSLATGATGNLVQNNFIGTNASGTGALGNGTVGVQISASSGNFIGGVTAAMRNIISANFVGVLMTNTANANFLQGNYIGLDATGATALGNNAGVNSGAVQIEGGSHGNFIGGTAAGAGNVISGNGSNGIIVLGPVTDDTQIMGNLIGTNPAGTAAIANTFSGVVIRMSANNFIGGVTAAARNLISGNGQTGVHIFDLGSTGNTVQGNFIGTNLAGTAGIPNNEGVKVNTAAGAGNNTIGGTLAGAGGNVIAFNTTFGVAVFQAANTGNRLRANSIFANGGPGIDLGGDGLTVNDAGDGDAGPNGLQNFPQLNPATTAGSITTVTGTLDSTPNATFRIEFFSNPSCDPSGNGEGQFFIGATDVITGGNGIASISATFPSLPALDAGGVVTATATDAAGNTSEFSPCQCNFSLSPTEAGIAAMGVTGNTVTIAAPGGCNWTAVSNSPFITVTGGSAGSGNGLVTYNVAPNPGTQPRTGSMTIAGYTFYATQAANGTVLNEGFNGGVPPDWEVMDTGGAAGGGDGMTWMSVSTPPCPQTPNPGLQPPFVLVDFTCAPPEMVPDESLITPPFDARGLGQVILQFDSVFRFQAGDLTVRGDVDISLDREMTWTNILSLTQSEVANTRTLNLTPFIPPDSADVRVRFRFYTTGPRPARPASPRAQELFWGIDRPTILALTVEAIEDFPPGGDTQQVSVIAPAGYSWQVTEEPDVPWVTIIDNGNRPSGVGTGTFTISTTAYGGICPRNTTVKVTIPGSGPTPLLTVSKPVIQFGSGLSILPLPPVLPSGFVGQPYNQSFSQTGSNGTITWSVSSGSLPPGLSLTPSTGVLSGTPTMMGQYTFTIKGVDAAANNCTGSRQYMLTISSVGSGLQFFPLPQPVRALETRAGFNGCSTPGTPINAGGTFTLAVRGGCTGIPANAAAVTGNITVVPSAGGFLTLFPSTATQPQVANSNFGAGEITNNVFTVGLGAGDGAFKIFASATTHVIVDVTGYYAPPGTGGLYFHPLATPVRLLETRNGFSGCIAPGTPLVGTGNPNSDPNLDQSLQGRSPIPSPCNSIPSSAQVLVGNATSVLPSGGGYLTIYPSGGTRPTVASSNYAGADVVNGPFAVKLGADGKFKVYTFATTHLVIDILGYYSEEANDANGAGLFFYPLPAPVRLLETRPDFPGLPLTGCTRTNAPIQGNIAAATHTQSAADFCGLPAAAQAVVGNVSVVNSQGAGFLTLFPANLTAAPLVATSNYPAPATFGYNRHYFVGLSPSAGTFKVLTQFTTDLILDASGYFAP